MENRDSNVSQYASWERLEFEYDICVKGLFTNDVTVFRIIFDPLILYPLPPRLRRHLDTTLISLKNEIKACGSSDLILN